MKTGLPSGLGLWGKEMKHPGGLQGGVESPMLTSEILCRREKFPRALTLHWSEDRFQQREGRERRREIKAIKLPEPPQAGNQGGSVAGGNRSPDPYFMGEAITIGHVTPENQKLKAISDELSE